MINIAIDGPSGAGKSTIADLLAERLGYTHLDTGAMYRAVGYCAVQHSVNQDSEEDLMNMIHRMDLVITRNNEVFLDGEDISSKIRENEISMAASNVSRHALVREAMVALQQRISSEGGYILDGRDIGTVVLKDAKVKIYLTASAEERANRRVKQNKENGIESDYQQILRDIIARDKQDMERENSPLRKAEDAIEIDSSFLSISEVVDKVLAIVEERS